MMILLILFILFISNPDSSSADIKQEILFEVNAIRQTGCYCGNIYMPPVKVVKWNSKLEKSAYVHAKDMHDNQYFSHVDRKGKDIGERADAIGYKWSYIGENIAEGQLNVGEVMEDWRKSVTHCTLMMNPNFEEMGVSKVDIVWVQHFGKQK
jgi:uncharacterized protein YkwD